MGSYQILPYHVAQAENLSFSYLKSYCPLNFRKRHQISWFCCIPNGSYKEDNLKEGRIPPPPPCGIGLISENDLINFSCFKKHELSRKRLGLHVRIFNPIRPGLFSRSPGPGGLRGPDAKNQG